MNPLKWKLHWQILLSLSLAIAIGVTIKLAHLEDTQSTRALVGICAFLGKLFMNALKMIVVPLIVSSIICGVMGLGAERNFGRLGLKTLGYYALSGLLAIIAGLLMVNVIRPGIVDEQTAQSIVGQAEISEDFKASFEGRGAGEMVEIFTRMLPPNIIKAATDNGQLLGLIVFSLIFGYFISRLPDKHLDFQNKLWESLNEIMMLMTDLIIRFAPIGVFGLVTPILIRTGFSVFVPLAWFVLTVAFSLGFHFLVTLPLLLKFVGGVSNPWQHYRAMAPVLLTAFSTASSASTLPVTLDTVQHQSGVSNKVSSFTLPLGATVNMDGTALYECVVVIFIAQFYSVLEGFSIGIGTQFLVVLMALLTSVGVAGIPAASLVAITVILGVVGLPLEAVGLVWVTDRILDMCRTAINVFSDTCGAVIIARTEGETIYEDSP